ncbi:flagellar hook-basal body protein [Peribacillus frigoritolerans]|uniref:flagellar hook-basal body protein n=1 Tax=Peribacillus frigoritolerans TaxID=450367 RepID=UPI001F5036B6|nr:flagellar hook-basal body protein [Peribacillus frigoritolerans]MCK2018718.1 flagellar hook-basal body protein [Peribacillus frigoritolerans]
MNRTMMTATNALNQLQSKIDQISNNIANVDTTAFKKTQTSFHDLLTQSFNNQPGETKEKGRLTAPGIRQGTGAMLSKSQLVLSQGALKTTDRNLDAAFTRDDQFFTVSVQDDNGVNTRLTRDGAFYLSPNANDRMMLVTSAGHKVLNENGEPILIEGNIKDIKISENGLLIVDTEEYGEKSFGLGIVSVKKPQFLDRLGGNLLGLPKNFNALGVTEDDILTALTGDSRNQAAVRQGTLESSNVDLSKEMTDLINVQRSYQFQSRAVTMADQMSGLVNGIR